jgi:uncharacterized protein (DUF2141 family)
MRHRSRSIVACLALTGAPLLVAAGAPSSQAAVHLEITGLRSAKGVVLVCMTPHPGRFPECRGDLDAYAQTRPASTTVSVDISNVVAGRYAIAVLHDENGNGKVDRMLGLMPKEGFGFSRDAPVRMGPPSFKEASFEVGTAPVRQSIRMRYML